jgi:alpha-galactosidase
MLGRRNFLWNATSALLLPGLAHTQGLNGAPASVAIWTENGVTALNKSGPKWQSREIEIALSTEKSATAVTLVSPNEAVLRVQLRWNWRVSESWRILGDAWERSYGDLAWRGLEPERVMPWYFLAFDGASTFALGVETGAASLCFWQVDPQGVSLWLDVRNGGRGVKLGKRTLTMATIVTELYKETKPFSAARQFCRRMCGHPLMPAAPVYGGNNWYYAYGKSSASDIRDDSERIASLASSSGNRPFMVIDDGWQPNSAAGPWSHGNEKFPDMPALAADMKRLGVQPGLWMRPLFTKGETPAGWRLQSPNAASEYAAHKEYTLDPTVPEAAEKIQQDLKTAISWGYSLIKHDFSTYDLLGRWGFRMGAVITDANWSFADTSRTNAEVIRNFYVLLRETAGNTMLLGCNTVGHLAAGLFELQRIGDDTSGRDWDRTRRMGVNTLAFRAAQHGSFFAIDADCVGVTKQVPWTLNKQWLDLLARSGTPLFVSAAPDALDEDKKAALKRAFAAAAKPQPLGEPLDWLENNEPQRWRLDGQVVNYDWFGTAGASPFSG